MSLNAIACPKCLVRLKVAAPAKIDKSFSCPKCGQVVLVPGLANADPRGQRVLLVALLGAVVLVGAAITAAILMTRTAPQPEHLPASVPVAVDTTNPEGVVKKQETQFQDEPEAKDLADKERRRQEYLRLMSAGGTKASAQKWQEALAAYEDALKLMPADVDAGLKYQEAKATLADQARAKVNEDKFQTDVKSLLDQGRSALGKKQHAAALEFFKLVLQKSPTDSAAVKGLVAAQSGLAQEQADRKKQEDFQKHLAAGQAAHQAGRYADAIKEFVAAQSIQPMNVQADRLQRDAEKMLALEKNRQERKADYNRLIDLAGTALRNQRYDDAIAAYQKALQIMPDDRSAAKGLADSRQALQNATLEFGTLMARGTSAMRDFRFRDAILAYREATRLSPENAGAAQALRIAELAFEHRIAYVAAMRRANLALTNSILDEAAAGYADALRIVPNDPLATLGLQEAQKGLADFVRRRRDADLQIQAGAAAAKQRKYAEAARAFKDALKILPTHPQAETLRAAFRYNDNMADGTMALNTRRYQDAVRHFQAALAESPNDAPASAGLARSRALVAKN